MDVEALEEVGAEIEAAEAAAAAWTEEAEVAVGVEAEEPPEEEEEVSEAALEVPLRSSWSLMRDSPESTS